MVGSYRDASDVLRKNTSTTAQHTRRWTYQAYAIQGLTPVFSTEAYAIDGNTVVGVYFDGAIRGFKYNTVSRNYTTGPANTIYASVEGSRIGRGLLSGFDMTGFVQDGATVTTYNEPGYPQTGVVGLHSGLIFDANDASRLRRPRRDIPSRWRRSNGNSVSGGLPDPRIWAVRIGDCWLLSACFQHSPRSAFCMMARPTPRPWFRAQRAPSFTTRTAA